MEDLWKSCQESVGAAPPRLATRGGLAREEDPDGMEGLSELLDAEGVRGAVVVGSSYATTVVSTPSIHARPDRKLMYHGWFMATDPRVMMQYWRESLLDDGNGTFLSLDVPFLDVQAIRPWDETPEETRRSTEQTMEAISPGPNYRLIFLYGPPRHPRSSTRAPMWVSGVK